MNEASAIVPANDNAGGSGSAIELRLGRWQDALADVGEVDVLISDPPYGGRTHGGQRHGRKDARYCDSTEHPLLSARGIAYAHWTRDEVFEFVRAWAPRNRGWFACFTSHDLWSAWEDAYEEAGLYVYAPIGAIQNAMNVRLAGDGPSNWTTWIMAAARPRWSERWGTLRGGYFGQSFDAGENGLDRSKRAVPGGKPLWLMKDVVRDYSRPGDLIVDPCAGGATTLLAAAIEGRRAIGAEMDPDTYAKAQARIARGYTPVMRFGDERPKAEQQDLLGGLKHG